MTEVANDRAAGDRVLVTTLTKKMAEDLTDYLLEQGLKVRYLHSNIDTLERIEILRDLRLGEFDVLVGINLLREGLDLPEVSLVAILDADKEGFLRSETSLIQTIGRAARNVDGSVIMYADEMTDSMQPAISETHRRRKLQQEYNTEHGINPQTVRRAVSDILSMLGRRTPARRTAPVPGADRRSRRHDRARSDLAGMPEADLTRLISALEDEMRDAAADLRFEYAARLAGRDDRPQKAQSPFGDGCRRSHSSRPPGGRLLSLRPEPLPDRFAQPLQRPQAPVHFFRLFGVAATHPALERIEAGRLPQGQLRPFLIGPAPQGADKAGLGVDSPVEAQTTGDGRSKSRCPSA